MTRRQLARSVGNRELVEWIAFYELEAWEREQAQKKAQMKARRGGKR